MIKKKQMSKTFEFCLDLVDFFWGGYHKQTSLEGKGQTCKGIFIINGKWLIALMYKYYLKISMKRQNVSPKKGYMIK